MQREQSANLMDDSDQLDIDNEDDSAEIMRTTQRYSSINQMSTQTALKTWSRQINDTSQNAPIMKESLSHESHTNESLQSHGTILPYQDGQCESIITDTNVSIIFEESIPYYQDTVNDNNAERNVESDRRSNEMYDEDMAFPSLCSVELQSKFQPYID